MTRRPYRNQVSLIFQGMSSAVMQAASLELSAQRLLKEGDHALALSVAVIALEEIGKAFLIDGLLFAKARDEKATAFERGHRRHTDKLRAVELLPQFVEKQSIADPRSEQTDFQARVSSAVTKYIMARRELDSAFGKPQSLEKLDELKQKGFYTELKDGAVFVLPVHAIAPSVASAVVELARCSVRAIELLFENGTQPFAEFVSEIRSKMTEADHAALEAAFDELYQAYDEDEKQTPRGPVH